jgi:hypothetical protein
MHGKPLPTPQRPDSPPDLNCFGLRFRSPWDPAPANFAGPYAPVVEGRGGRRGRTDPRIRLRRVLWQASTGTRVARPASLIPFPLNTVHGLLQEE